MKISRDPVQKNAILRKAEKQIKKESEEQATNVHWLIIIICVGWVSFQIYTGLTGVRPPLQQRSVHLLFALVLVFALVVERRGLRNWKGASATILLLASGWAAGHIVVNHYRISIETGQFQTVDLIAGATLLLATLEAARRKVGLAIPVIAITAMAYSYFGNYLPGRLFHSGYSLESILSYQMLSLQGVFGIALGIIASFVFLFILYAGLLQVTGTGQLFIDLATGLFGRVRGGPGKIAVVASGAFGSISGSAVANVATTGPITIPLMKRVGFKPRFAAAVEATASSGGQFTPPMMGAAAFIISEVLAIPFYQVALAAAIPAALFFLSVILTVDIESVKDDIRGVPKAELPSVKDAVVRGWPLLISPGVLVYCLVIIQYSPMRSAMITIGATILATLINRSTRLRLRQYLDVAVAGAKGSLEVSIACASVGTITGVIAQTGVGFQLSGLLIDASGGSLLLLLLLTMATSIILGMGLPTVAAYLVLSITVAPALVQFGAHELAAHLFVFYFGALSAITPPVALASLVAASLAGTKIWSTSFEALRVAFAGFIIPISFIYNPGLLVVTDSWFSTLTATVSTAVALIVLSHALGGYLFRSINLVASVVLVCLGVFMITPTTYALAAAVTFLGAYIIASVWTAKRAIGKVEGDVKSNA